MKARDLPASAVVIGGGAIGCEFASMMADLGTEVTVLEALPKILPGLDADVTKVVERSFKKRGITVHTGVQVTGHEPGGKGTTVRFGEDQSIEVERVIVSVGRRPLSDVLGLDGTGVEVDERGFVTVDENCRTTLAGVWAVGDLIPTAQLAHIGFAEAHGGRAGHPGRGPRADRLHPGALVHLLPSRGGLRRPLRGGGQGGGPRRGDGQAPASAATVGR